MNNRTSHQRKQGLRPGALVYTGSSATQETNIKTHILDGNSIETSSGLSAGQEGKLRWIEITGLQDLKGIAELATSFSISPLSVEDVFSTDQRMKIDYYDSYFSWTMKVLELPNKKEEQLTLFVGKNWIISILEYKSDIFVPVIHFLNTKQGLHKKVDSFLLFHAMVDCVVDQYLVRADELDAKTEEMEALVINTPERVIGSDIHRLKRKILHLRRISLPLKDLLASLIRAEHIDMGKPTIRLFRDTSDHALWLSEECEMLRETVSGLMEVYLASLDVKMNKIMKVLTIISTTFIPLTFLTGLYGMNFLHIPLSEQHWGFYAMLLCCIFIVIFMAGWFKRKRWW